MPSPFTEQTWPRPLMALTLAFLLALVIERLGPSPPTDGLFSLVAPTTVVLLVALWVLLWLRGSCRWPILPLLLFFLLGLLAHRIAAPPNNTISSLAPFLEKPPTLFVAEVMTTPDPLPDKTRLSLHLLGAYSSSGGVPLDTGVILTIRNCQRLWLPGQLLLARLQLRRIHGFHNPGGYDYERAQADRSFFASAFLPEDSTLVPLSAVPPWLDAARRHSSYWQGSVARFRWNALQWLKSQLPPDAAAIYAALLLGFQNQVPKDMQEHWNRAGVTHLLSISGQHLGMVAMAAFWLLRGLFRFRTELLERWSDQRLALWGAVVLALLYAAIGGLSLPTWRSAIMLSLFFAGIAWGRPTDWMSALSLAALLILLLEPNALWTPSFQLTFAAMIGIFLVYPRFGPARSWLWHRLARATESIGKAGTQDSSPPDSPSKWRWLAPFADAFWVSLAVNILVLPLVIHHFHGVSLVGLVANCVLVPLMGFLVLPLGLLCLALFGVNHTLAGWLLAPAGWSMQLSESLIEFFSHRSWAYYWLGDLGIPSLVLIYAILGTLFSRWRWRTKAMLAAGMVLATVIVTRAPSWFLPDRSELIHHQWQHNHQAGYLQVLFIDVGQGSSTLLACPDGSTILVDGGGFHDDTFDVGRNVVAPLLWHLGIKRLDAVILSHDHPDHGNGLRFILSHFEVASFWESGVHDPMTSTEAGTLAEIVTRRGISLRTLDRSSAKDALAAHGLYILHPTPDFLASRWDRENLNNASLVLEAVHSNTRVVLPGDIDENVERLLTGDLRRPVRSLLVAPHHGSRHGTSAALLHAVNPELVVFSCGFGNRFGFPHQSVLQRLRDRAVPVRRTDQDGAIWAVSDGNSWRLRLPTGSQTVPH